MQVYKFGGISVKNADSVKNISEIIRNANANLVVVISAMGKMTNKFEKLVNLYFFKNDFDFTLAEIKKYHINIIDDLFEYDSTIYKRIDNLFTELEYKLSEDVTDNYDYEYDKIIVYGELLSTTIISEYLNAIGIKNSWIDIRNNIITDGFFRDGRVIWDKTQTNLINNIAGNKIVVTQGFIASDEKGDSVTLGREGSDFTASIIAYSLNAESVTIWKDVPGILTADPRIFSDTVKIDKLNYKETVELAYYGAQVIHPKTIKPLQNKNIPLFVKSFLNFNEKGTEINNSKTNITSPIIILKKNQVLISISPKDFSFIDETNISKIYTALAELKIKVNLMENSAVSYSIVTDNSKKIDLFIQKLEPYYLIRYNTNLELITIRHYNKNKIAELLDNKIVLVEQKTRFTARYVVKNS
jgi:aspartate kinase